MVIRLNVRLNGTIGAAAVERFSVGLNYGGGAAVLTNAEAQAAASAIAGVLAASSGSVFGSMANGVGIQVAVTDVDVYSYPVSGPAASHGLAPLSPNKSFTGTQTAPPQTAAVISLQTAVPGASYRGRLYWPQTAPTLDTSFKSSTAKGLGPGFVAVNNAIESVLNTYGAWVLSVYSPTLDVVTPVTSVRCGDVLDTQRRRRDALVESYTATPV